jgi:two-component system, NtrC family, sensor kinase
MKASILIVGHPYPEKVEFGADHCRTYDEALDVLAQNSYAVVVAADKLPQTQGKVLQSLEFLEETKKINSDVQSILVSSQASPSELKRAINSIGIFKIIPQFETAPLQLAVREALEEYELIKQNEAFLALTQEQNQKLQQLSGILEERVRAREKFLNQAREALLQATRKTEALNRALVAIQKNITRQQMETSLKDALHPVLGLTWIRILLKDQLFIDHIGHEKTPSTEIFSAPLFREKDLLGHIYFARENSRPFQPDEDDFLLQVSDAVGLAIDRINAMEAIEGLKQEWDSTFDAITEPVSIVDETYTVIRANKAYAERAGQPLPEVSGKKCYKLLFGRNEPCSQCKLGTGFDLGETRTADGAAGHFAVTSHRIPGKIGFALFYRDISEEERIQRQILESSKMAEIGTIGSSIAHEINNPLGGMIAFLQILKGELTPKDKIFSDIDEMEKAAIRCKTIVENLLAFTRQSSPEKQITRLGELLKIVTNIMELQTRGLGIAIEKNSDNLDVKLEADTNQLVQVLVNIMQNSCEAIAGRMEAGIRQPPGKITVHTSLEDPDTLTISITDNGTGIPTQDLARVFTPFFTTKGSTNPPGKNPGLGLSVSYQIVKEHGGQMEVSSLPGQSTTVVVQLKVAKGPTA